MIQDVVVHTTDVVHLRIPKVHVGYGTKYLHEQSQNESCIYELRYRVICASLPYLTVGTSGKVT